MRNRRGAVFSFLRMDLTMPGRKDSLGVHAAHWANACPETRKLRSTTAWAML